MGAILAFIISLMFDGGYDYTKGEILSPDYVHYQTILVIESCNLPDSCETDQQIYDFLMSDKFEVIE